MTKNTKIEIAPYNNEINNIEIYKELKNLRRVSFEACNRASAWLFYNAVINKQMNLIDYKKSFGSYIEDILKDIMFGYNTKNIAQTRQFVMGKQNFNEKEVLNGNRKLSTYNLNNPIIIHNKSFKFFYDKKNNYYIEIGLFSNEKKKEYKEKGYDVGRIMFKLNNIHDSGKVIINRILNGEYKQGAGQITYNERKKKWMFGISYTFESQKECSFDINRILGIDLGITNTATMSVYDMSVNSYDYLKYAESIISGTELRHYRNTIEKKKIELQKATKWSSDNKIGHGRKQRMSDVDKIGDKCARFRDTYNHKISRYIINQAIKYNCGVIQMENLSGFSKVQEDSMLKSWAYYDLQQKIKYKAEEVGITFRLINPMYTSKRCSVCGCIHEENRNCKKNQAKFECVKCGHKMNADVNASRNIALPDIETLIKNELHKNKTNVA